MKHILSVSMPRSGHHLLVRLLQAYYGEQFSYCDYYGVEKKDCCQKIPCIQVSRYLDGDYIFVQKNHDHRLQDPFLSEYKYIVQYRHPIPRSVSNFEVFVKNRNVKSKEIHKKRNTSNSFYDFLERDAKYYIDFYQKYIAPNFPNVLVLQYEYLVDNPKESLKKIVNFIQNDDEFSSFKWSTASSELKFANRKGVKFAKRNIFDFRFFDVEKIKRIEENIFKNCPEIEYNSCLNEELKYVKEVSWVESNYNMSDEEFIEAAYLKFLKRNPGIEGKNFYLEALRNSKLTREQLIHSLKSSSEFKTKSFTSKPI